MFSETLACSCIRHPRPKEREREKKKKDTASVVTNTTLKLGEAIQTTGSSNQGGGGGPYGEDLPRGDVPLDEASLVHGERGGLQSLSGGSRPLEATGEAKGGED